MDFEMKYEGAREVYLPMTREMVETGQTCTIDEKQLVMLADAGYVIGPRSPYTLTDPEHTREVVIGREGLELQDEDGNTRVYGEMFEASDQYLVEMHHLLFNGRLVEADTFEGEAHLPEPEPDDEPDIEELTGQDRIEQALASDNYNVMRSAVADLSDAPATGNKDDMRDRLEAMLDAEG